MTETVEKGLKKIGVTVSKPVLALIAVSVTEPPSPIIFAVKVLVSKS